jgi:hypothetical protein
MPPLSPSLNFFDPSWLFNSFHQRKKNEKKMKTLSYQKNKLEKINIVLSFQVYNNNIIILNFKKTLIFRPKHKNLACF